MRRILCATMLVGAVAMALASVGTASRTQQQLTCDGTPYTLTVTSTSNDNSVAWGVGTISGGDHLIPTSFSGEAVDLSDPTVGVLFSFSQAKGNGNGLHNQPTLDCSTTETDTAGDLGIPGINPSDLIQTTFTATAVLKP